VVPAQHGWPIPSHPPKAWSMRQGGNPHTSRHRDPAGRQHRCDRLWSSPARAPMSRVRPVASTLSRCRINRHCASTNTAAISPGAARCPRPQGGGTVTARPSRSDRSHADDVARAARVVAPTVATSTGTGSVGDEVCMPAANDPAAGGTPGPGRSGCPRPRCCGDGADPRHEQPSRPPPRPAGCWTTSSRPRSVLRSSLARSRSSCRGFCTNSTTPTSTWS
jgi:hypothetical protein